MPSTPSSTPLSTNQDGNSLPVIDSGATAESCSPESACTSGITSSLPYGDLVDRLIHSQQQLTAVERFSQQHASISSPTLEPRYKELIPLDVPGVGEQYSFEVDLDACSGCKACVVACHNLNGLEEGELWRNVGMLVGGGEKNPEIQHVTAACHHCLEPACMHGCPVNAYEKDEVTGIVSHLDDQCIGCKYCMFMCPYDVPTFSKSKGIVRKCNMCSDRLAVGEAPACVQSCPHQAIKIRTISCEEIIDNSETDQLVPGAPDVHVTMPTTRYNTKRVLPRNLLPDDYYTAKSLHAHFPLVFMLTLTQMAFGIFAVGFLANQIFPSVMPGLFARLDVIGFAALAIGSNLAILHLGRPGKAYRAMAGIRTSWLSREILGFNFFAAAAAGLLLWGLSDLPQQWTGISRWWLALATTVTGAAGVACSAMLYIATKRPLWTGFRTTSLFFLTAAILGTATVIAGIHWLTSDNPVSIWLATGNTFAATETVAAMSVYLAKVLIVFAAIKLIIEGSIFTHLNSFQFTPQRHAAHLMTGDMQWPTTLRYVFLVVGGIVFPTMYLVDMSAHETGLPGGAIVLTTISLALLLAAELIERYLFFAVSVARRMPGAPN